MKCQEAIEVDITARFIIDWIALKQSDDCVRQWYSQSK